jgi:hypothetical protein
MPDTPTYQLTVTAEQLRLLQYATELMARIGMGQWGVVTEASEMTGREIRTGPVRGVGQCLKEAEAFLVPADLYTDKSEILFDIFKVFRHRLAYDRLKPGEQPEKVFVYSDPLRHGSEPLAKVVKIDG